MMTSYVYIFFLNDTAATETYTYWHTLPLHDALPIFGERRWRPPARPAKWEGVREARSFGPDGVQPSYPAASVYFEPPRPMREDCLTLNIWAPERADGAPVIV